MVAATRSRAECAASDKIPRLLVVTPTKILRPVMAKAANKELPAALRFSARIDSEANVAGTPDILELSLCGRVPPSDQRQVDLLGPVLGFFITLQILRRYPLKSVLHGV